MSIATNTGSHLLSASNNRRTALEDRLLFAKLFVLIVLKVQVIGTESKLKV